MKNLKEILTSLFNLAGPLKGTKRLVSIFGFISLLAFIIFSQTQTFKDLFANAQLNANQAFWLILISLILVFVILIALLTPELMKSVHRSPEKEIQVTVCVHRPGKKTAYIQGIEVRATPASGRGVVSQSTDSAGIAFFPFDADMKGISITFGVWKGETAGPEETRKIKDGDRVDIEWDPPVEKPVEDKKPDPVVLPPIPPTKPDAPEIEAARRKYLTGLQDVCQFLPLILIGGDRGSELTTRLDDVYIHLNTTTPLEDKDAQSKKKQELDRFGREEKLPVLQAARDHSKLVLLGDPGSGKSAFVKELAYLVADAALGNRAVLEGFEEITLPLLINLRDLAARLAKLELGDLPDHKKNKLLREAWLKQVREELEKFETPELYESLLAGLPEHGLLILDGLDEVPYAQRELVRDAVYAILDKLHLKRIIVTCRVRSYKDDLKDLYFDAFTIAPLNPDQIEYFIKAWYDHQYKIKAEAKGKADDLVKAATKNDLLELAENPLMLTTMALIHQNKVELPKQRVLLYKEVVDILIRRWQKEKDKGTKRLSPKLQEFIDDNQRLYPAMYTLAYTAHCSGCKQGGEIDLPRGEALCILGEEQFLGNLELAQEFLDYIDLRTGLLLGKGGEISKPPVYSFPHRTFQEYLTACYLAAVLRDTTDTSQELLRRCAEGVDWSLAAQLAAEELIHSRGFPNYLLSITYDLLDEGGMQDVQHQRAWLWSASFTEKLRKIYVAGAGAKGQKHLNELLPALVNLLSGQLTPPERAEAGNILARLGDDRREVMDVDGLRFCFIPAGDFWFQKEKVPLPDACWLGEYPVSNAQFDVFVQESGYTDSRWWQDAGKYWSEQGFKVQGESEHRTKPVEISDPFNLPNHPVVRVSWYEAWAFTLWLTARWQARGWLPDAWTVTLPSEQQWEKAARGGLQIPALNQIQPLSIQSIAPRWLPELATVLNPDPRRAYPWEGEFSSELANTDESHIGATSPLGCFPRGRSPYGVQELSGNVWEWQTDWYGKDKDYKNLRGGSWYYAQYGARCDSRYWFNPDGRFSNIGFRLSLSRRS